MTVSHSHCSLFPMGGWTVQKVLFSFDCPPLQIWMSNTFECQTHIWMPNTSECQSHIWTLNSHLNIKLQFLRQICIWISISCLMFESQTHLSVKLIFDLNITNVTLPFCHIRHGLLWRYCRNTTSRNNTSTVQLYRTVAQGIYVYGKVLSESW